MPATEDKKRKKREAMERKKKQVTVGKRPGIWAMATIATASASTATTYPSSNDEDSHDSMSEKDPDDVDMVSDSDGGAKSEENGKENVRPSKKAKTIQVPLKSWHILRLLPHLIH